MSDFHKEQKHEGFALLYGSSNIERAFKYHTKDIPFFVVKDREEKRVASMLDSLIVLGHASNERAASAVSCVAIANSEAEYVAMSAGLIAIRPQGINICVACLQKAIISCEEQLTVLKDIQEMSKTYVDKL